jgi:5'-deoxynucleotidase YfbR-like HD superfamily hydrolase
MGQVNSLLPLADLALRLGAVNRATLYPDGVTPESDTDHTVMLALMACAVASTHPELGLNIGLVCQFAVVHDLPEAWAGDTDSFFTAATGHAPGKAEREAAAVRRINRDCADWPWLRAMMYRYEQQKEPEARFVRYMDKVCPPLTNTLNGGAAIRARGVGKAGTQDAAHAARLAALYPEFATIVGAYLREACDASEAAFAEEPHPHDALEMDWSAR